MRRSSNLKNFYTTKNKDQLKKVIEVFSKSLFKVTEVSTLRAASRLHTYILDVLDTQSYNWKPLSAAYKKRKEKKGLDTRILLATHEYRDSIFYKENKDGSVVVGVPNKIHQDSGLHFNMLARIHEFGSKKVGIPARPLWRPAMSWWVRDLNSTAKKEMLVNLSKMMRNKVSKIS